MKAYRITKIIYAKDFITAIKNEEKAEIVEITLNESIEKPNASIGFTR
jgi:hypothetical protein